MSAFAFRKVRGLAWRHFSSVDGYQLAHSVSNPIGIVDTILHERANITIEARYRGSRRSTGL